jgi:nucleotide-binding universal stress UspA family protein
MAAVIQKILVPVDFSSASGAAARYASEIAGSLDAELTLLHVAPPLAFEFAMAQPAQSRYQELAAHRNQAVQHAMETFPAGEQLLVKPTRLVHEGEAVEEILRTAQTGEYDLIVMPTRGSGPLRRLLLIGSVTSKVLHGAECPVLAAVDFEQHYNPVAIQQILCAVDLGPQSAHVLRWGAGLAAHYGARLSIVHAAPGAGEAAEDYFDASWRNTLLSRLHEKVSELASDAGAAGEILVEPGDPHKVVSQKARELGTNIIVIGRGDSNDLLGRLRAHAYEIIRQSPCPVLSV